ncbi:hypothetical protein RRG08_020603 [Elysia crispata]|uniref:Uncharacterized protein n=1 Tax=Elysia crispata TaxID=231223 RepID=A0AAE1A6F3_9GAST|nr:hypothetical protein RRG08_020603 [Elysia crispata]
MNHAKAWRSEWVCGGKTGRGGGGERVISILAFSVTGIISRKKNWGNKLGIYGTFRSNDVRRNCGLVSGASLNISARSPWEMDQLWGDPLINLALWSPALTSLEPLRINREMGGLVLWKRGRGEEFVAGLGLEIEEGWGEGGRGGT